LTFHSGTPRAAVDRGPTPRVIVDGRAIAASDLEAIPFVETCFTRTTLCAAKSGDSDPIILLMRMIQFERMKTCSFSPTKDRRNVATTIVPRKTQKIFPVTNSQHNSSQII
jgi:hypothetical protein